MSLQITKGKTPGAVRAVFYGVEGIGKSTLATKIPGCLVNDVEDGSSQIDCSRVVPADYRAAEGVVDDMIKDSQGFTCLIVDTADWFERSMIANMLERAGKQSIEDFGYGKGYTMLAENFSRFLGKVDKLIAKGVHVVFVAHASVKRTSPPDQTDGYDRYELKLTKQVAPLLKEWADLILFFNYKVQIVEGTDGRLKAQGGKERMMFSTHSAAWDAKNRFGLPEEMPMSFDGIAHLFGGVAKVMEQPKAPAETTAPNLATAAQVKWLEAQSKVKHASHIEAAFDSAGAIGFDELTQSEAEALITKMRTADSAAAVATDIVKQAVDRSDPTPMQVPLNVAAWLDKHAETVNAYLARVGWVGAGKTWRNLAEDKLTLVSTKPEKFARASAIPALA